jgi:hypothetical protein
MNLKQRLTEQEKAVIHDMSEYVYFEIIKGMTPKELSEFRVYIPKNQRHYLSVETEWLDEERYLIKRRTGYCTDEELIEDANKNHNFDRFRAYYCLKYPGMVSRLEDLE